MFHVQHGSHREIVTLATLPTIAAAARIAADYAGAWVADEYGRPIDAGAVAALATAGTLRERIAAAAAGGVR